MPNNNYMFYNNRGNYLKALVIVHGKSELQMCNFIKKNLRLNVIDIISKNKGKNPIQITSLMKILNEKNLKLFNNFLIKYEDKLNLDKNRKLNNNFKIFIIMDTDDCKEEEKNNFINKNMFKNHLAYRYIVPIYNITNLEDVLVKSKVIDKNTIKNKKDKKDYIKIFPTDDKYIKSDTIQIEEFYKKLLKVKNYSNMHEFIKFCLDNKYTIKK